MPEADLKPALAANGKTHETPLTVLSEGDDLRGRLVMKGDGHLLGAFDGEVECEGELLIGKDARVTADITTVNITVSGLVKGNIAASGRLRITTTGRLEGDARVGALVVQEGGVHHGVIRVHPEGLPAVEEAPAEEPVPAPVAVAPAPRGAGSVDRVKKFWGEFF